MTNVVSVITPVVASAAMYLPDAYESLAAQELPTGWGWQWVVQEDGQTGDVASLLPDDPRITFGSGRHGGPGVARTMALPRAEGAFIKALDADDVLATGALARDIAVLTERPDIGWTTAKALDLLPDGSTVGWDDDDPAEGPLVGTAAFEYWLAHDYRLPVLPGTLCIRRELLLALGGWMALPASEDTGMLLAASVLRDGYFIAEAGLLYRKWAGQSTAQASHVDPAERPARMAVIEARVRALLALREAAPLA